MKTRPRVLTPTFVLLSGATFFFFLSGSALTPVLPRHLEALGASDSLIGLTMGIELLPAVLLRPFAGRYIDRRGRKGLMVVGLIIDAVANFAYAFAPNIPAIMAVRLLHGSSIACYYPSASVMAGDLSPAKRRAEVFSYFSMFLFAGLAAGPAVGEHIFKATGASVAFVFAGAAAVAGLLMAVPITAPRHRPPKKSAPLLHRVAVFPAITLGLVALTSGGLHAFIPLYADRFGAGDSRFFFTTYASTILLARIFVGRVADRYGRAVVVVPGATLCGVSSLVVMTGAGPLTLTVAAVLFGLGWGGMFPGLFAAIMDRVHPHERGAATGTFTSAFDFAFGGGQIVLGAVLDATGFGAIFLLGAITSLTAGGIFLGGNRRWDSRFPRVEETALAATYPAGAAASASS